VADEQSHADEAGHPLWEKLERLPLPGLGEFFEPLDMNFTFANAGPEKGDWGQRPVKTVSTSEAA